MWVTAALRREMGSGRARSSPAAHDTRAAGERSRIASPPTASPEEKPHPLAATRSAQQLGSPLRAPFTSRMPIELAFSVQDRPSAPAFTLASWMSSPPPRLTLSCFPYVSINNGTLSDTRGQCKPAVIGRVRAGAVPRSTPSGNAPAARRPLRLVAEAARPERVDR